MRGWGARALGLGSSGGCGGEIL
ncbi:hypothetical protein RB213_015531, partial [Colletotrichum asianum]